MTVKKESMAEMRRKIQRLEEKLAAAEAFGDKIFGGYRDALYESVDYKIRIEQALKILSGEET